MRPTGGRISLEKSCVFSGEMEKNNDLKENVSYLK